MPLPQPYHAWFVAVVGAEPPDNPAAPCATCPMCEEGRFRWDTRCCTYAPSLPNFRAGGALSAGGEGARRVAAQQREGRATATWLHPSAADEARYDAERHRFGETDAVRCPYVSDVGTCTIHDHRNAVCATWFCRHGGPAGEALWDAAADLFHFAEGGAAVWASSDTYERAAERAASLTWDDLRRLGGKELAAREAALVAAYAAWKVDQGGTHPSPRRGPPPR